ncbi:MAG TPA: GIY-YIG nuclease family protein [Paludibacter sp.]
MFYVYILYSKIIDAYYVGQTIDVNKRIEEHNSKFYKNTSTAKANDWMLHFLIECTSRNQAILIESHIKSMKSRKYYESIKKYPEISDKLKKTYQ